MEKLEDLYMPNCIRTYTGIYVNVFDPKPEMFCIEDIAHALSNQCRFGGHLKDFYSVAQHSIHVCNMVYEDEHKLAALLHDASEAYLLDIPSPVKRGLSNYKQIEDGIMKAISERFCFSYPFDPSVKIADEAMLELEWDVLMLNPDNNKTISVMTPERARKEFVELFNHVTKVADDDKKTRNKFQKG